MKDKVVFWLGNDYTHYCLAHQLQKSFDCSMYAIIEVAERPKIFFQNQKLVNFEKIWFFHDEIKNRTNKIDYEYLAEFEKKYNVNLWKLVQNERIFLYYKNFHKYSPEEILQILEQECRFFEHVIEEIGPDFFFTKISSLHHQELFYQMCKNSGVKVQILTYSTLGKHCIITQEPAKLDQMDDLNLIEGKNRNFSELQEYLHSFDLLKQLDSKILKPGSSTLEMLRAAKEFLLHYDVSNMKTHYTYYGRTKLKVLFYHLIDNLRTKLRGRFVNRNLKTKLDRVEHFVYFPLHTEIERTLLIAAPYYVNQIEVIRAVARSLPINFKLYVKEHPAQIARSWRSSSEYKEIMNIPNVVLLHPKFSNEELYKKCSLLFTIGGTAGFEASFYGKPVIALIEVNYSSLPSVHIVNSLEEISDTIRKALNEKIESSNLDRYITLLERNISKFDYADFMANLAAEFFYGNNLMDVEISEDKMRAFLEKHGSSLQVLVNDHIKKIKWLKEQ